jgi:hypothetical protein
MWVAPARTCEDLERRESIYVLWTAIPNPSTKDEAQLNCVALRPQLDYEVACRPVKGQDERPKPAPLTALQATGRSVVDVGEKQIWRAATSALTFMTFS